MLVYFNSSLKFDLGDTVELPKNLLMFQELISAQNELEGAAAKVTTYKVIIDEQIHDPLVHEQCVHVYKPCSNGLYPEAESQGVPREVFFDRITNTVNSRDAFLVNTVLNQIADFGFAAVWVFVNKKRCCISVKPMVAKIIGICRGNSELHLK